MTVEICTVAAMVGNNALTVRCRNIAVLSRHPRHILSQVQPSSVLNCLRTQGQRLRAHRHCLMAEQNMRRLCRALPGSCFGLVRLWFLLGGVLLNYSN